jgi:hypothetical protein
MGFDISVVTKHEFRFRGGGYPNYPLCLNRGFCTMIMNADHGDDAVLPELERCLKMDLSFLLEPRYHDPQLHAADIQASLTASGIEWDEEEFSGEPTGWVQIAPFVIQLQSLQHALQAQPGYHARMNYDKAWWLNYFDAELRADIQLLLEFLEAAQDHGLHEFSFDIQ